VAVVAAASRSLINSGWNWVGWRASSVLAYRQVVQAQASLWAADGIANEEIARRSGVGAETVRRWRTRFADKGVADIGKIAEGRGRKSWHRAGVDPYA
jgi:hypothetical protein